VLSVQQTYGSAQTGAITLATSTATTFNGLTLSNSVTNSGGTFTVAPNTITGTLNNTGLTNSTISGISLGGTLNALTAGNTSLTFSGSYDGSTARTVSLNLNNANTWTALQTFSSASSTLFSNTGTAYFGGTATSTFNSAGQLSLAGLTNTLLYANGSNVVSSASVSSPLSFAAGTLSIQNAAADGSTKGAASFAANDFDASSGNISLDYTNGQAASASLKGFLTSADWTLFNNKVSSTFIAVNEGHLRLAARRRQETRVIGKQAGFAAQGTDVDDIVTMRTDHDRKINGFLTSNLESGFTFAHLLLPKI
jgi:hypothetical protein